MRSYLRTGKQKVHPRFEGGWRRLCRYKKNGTKIRISDSTVISPAKALEQYCILSSQGRELLRKAYDQLGISARAYHRILKVARTIADMENSEIIQKEHLQEAIGYRVLDKKYWR